MYKHIYVRLNPTCIRMFVVCRADVSCSEYIAYNGRIVSKQRIGKDFSRRDHDLTEAISRNLPGGVEENYEKSQCRIAVLRAEIQFRNLPNMKYACATHYTTTVYACT
jgi:hypothetical protein